MGKIIVAIVGLTLSVLIGCATQSAAPQHRVLLPEEQTYLDKVMLTPLEFVIPKTEANDAWGRAQSFISKFSGMKLQTVTEFVIQTYTPTSSDGEAYYSGYCGYQVTKTPMGDNIQITVQSMAGRMFTKLANRNAHILAHYIKTGELNSNLILEGPYNTD
jgi:hypothetical protein